jgi:L-seryl-tRNA(Ser) seleniumtransferase
VLKAINESVSWVVAALAESYELDLAQWQQQQTDKVMRFVERAGKLPGIEAVVAPDPTGLLFARARLRVDVLRTHLDAITLATELLAGDPPVWLTIGGRDKSELVLDLLPLTEAEIDTILVRMTSLLMKSRQDELPGKHRKQQRRREIIFLTSNWG